MSAERVIRRLLVWQRDLNAVRRCKVGRRVDRRIYGKASGRLERKLFG